MRDEHLGRDSFVFVFYAWIIICNRQRYNYISFCTLKIKRSSYIRFHCMYFMLVKLFKFNNEFNNYRQTFNISHTKCFSCHLAVVSAHSIEAKNEDIVGAAPTGDAPTKSEWSTILLPTKVPLILEVWLITTKETTYSPEQSRPFLYFGSRSFNLK